MATVEGLDKLNRRLAAMPAETKRQVSAAIEKSAQELVAQAKRFAPVEKGDLRDSVEWHWTGQGDDSGLGAASVSRQSVKGAENLSATITAGGTPQGGHAGWVEFGTSGGEGHAATPAQPFFFPAYRLLRKRIRTRIATALSKAIKASVGR
jgi:HK97 gp10 family phage protein